MKSIAALALMGLASAVQLQAHGTVGGDLPELHENFMAEVSTSADSKEAVETAALAQTNRLQGAFGRAQVDRAPGAFGRAQVDRAPGAFGRAQVERAPGAFGRLAQTDRAPGAFGRAQTNRAPGAFGRL